jgi:hypothetical protein
VTEMLRHLRAQMTRFSAPQMFWGIGAVAGCVWRVGWCVCVCWLDTHKHRVAGLKRGGCSNVRTLPLEDLGERGDEDVGVVATD